MTRKRSRFCTLLLAAFMLCGCASVSPQRIAARKIQQALPQQLGPADKYMVSVEGGTGQLSRGRARRVVVDGVNVRVADNLTLSTLHLDAADVSFDRNANHLDRVGQTLFAASMSQSNLNTYVAQQPNPFGFAVHLRAADAVVSLPITAGPIHTTVAVAGRFVPDASDLSAVNFQANRALLGFLPVPAFAVNAALRELGPVVKLSGFRVPVALDTISVRNGTLELSGTARLQDLSP